MQPPGTVTNWLHQLSSDSPAVRGDAATHIFARYFQVLIGKVVAQADRRILLQVDPEQIALNSLNSFFLRYKDGRFRLTSRLDLEKLLVKITLNKTYEMARSWRRKKRDARRNQQPSLAAGENAHDLGRLIEFMASNEPSPDEVAIVNEALAMLPDDLRRVALLALAGNTTTEIAVRLDRSPETIRLRKRAIEQLWREIFADS